VKAQTDPSRGAAAPLSLDQAPAASPAPGFADAVRAGLARPQKIIPARFFYDRAGSELFERITELPEYYPTRTEAALLAAHAPDAARAAAGVRTVVEFGSGSSAKTPLLLDAVRPRTYVPVDISAEFLAVSAAALAERHPGLEVVPVAADFAAPFALPPLKGPVMGFFPGSTLGNFAHGAAVDLLRLFARALGGEAGGGDAWLLIGLDRRKAVDVLERAYDDAAGVTAAFNLNLLARVNRELGGTVPLEAFRHRARWNERYGRVEMHLEATRDVSFDAAGRSWRMTAGETIHTENSYKYSEAGARVLALASGWVPVAEWTDADGLFALHLWRADGGAMEP